MPPGRKFHYDPGRGRLYVAGTHDNQVWELAPPFEGHVARAYYGELRAPNEVWLSPGDWLWVADTDHRRVVELAQGPAGGEETGRRLDGVTSLTSKHWPLDFAGSGEDGWWVLLSGITDRDGVIVAYANDGTPDRLIELPAGSDPIAVESLGDGALVADIAGLALYRVDPTGQVTRFGDQTFKDALDEARSEHAEYKWIERLSLALLVVGVVGAVGVVVLLSRAQTAGSGSGVPAG